MSQAAAAETALAALEALIAAAVAPVALLRDEPVPVSVPSEGLVILRYGAPGEPETMLSPYSEAYEHAAELALYSSAAAAAGRRGVVNGLYAAIAAAIAADRRLGGAVDLAELGALALAHEAIEGAATMAEGLATITLHYETS